MSPNEIMSEPGEKAWKKFIRKHSGMLALGIVGAVAACIGAVLVFLWFAGNAQSTGLVPGTLGLWSMGHVVSFILWLVLWEILFIGIPVAVAFGVTYFLWWKLLPEEERREYRHGQLLGKRSRRADSSGAASFFVFFAFVIKVYVDGNWDVPIATWTFNYVVNSLVLILIWITVIIGIPLLLGGMWWLRREMRRSP